MAKHQRQRAAAPRVPSAAGVADRLLATALVAHKAGRLAEAEPTYHRVLTLAPDNVRALHLLGLCLVGQNREEEAIAPLARAVALQPGRADLASDHGAALRASGRHAEAEAAFGRAVEADPGHVTAVRNLVGALIGTGRLDAAVEVLHGFLSAKPAEPQLVLHFVDQLGNRGHRAQALELFRLAGGLLPRDVAVRNSIGLLLLALGRNAEALTAFDEALVVDPHHANSHCNRGISLYRLGRVDEALAAYERAIASDPHCMPALNNIGSLHADRDEFRKAIDAYERAHAVDPNFVSTLFELVNQRRYGCQWDGLAEKQAKLDTIVARDGTRLPPFPSLFSDSSPAVQLKAAEIWARGLAVDPAEVLPADWRPVVAGERVRIGYISGDFHQHATATLVAELFERHDRSRFEVYGYAFGKNDHGAMRLRLEAAFDHFLDLGAMTDVEAARRIRADGIDILVDLKGYSRGARPEILALRPAPVQVNYLTYPATMGADFIDYIVVDEIIAPPEHQAFFSERLVHLPGCYQPNDSRREIASTCPGRAAFGLPEDGFVFCSFNNNYKITPEVFSIWMRLLQGVPGSVLWLLEGNAIARENLMREAAARGVDPGRLVFAPRAKLADHLARHRHADLFLDTLPVNAHTTASDALWAGLPVLTCAGESFVARVAASLNYAVGLPELVTTSLADYEQVALALATDPDLLDGARARLRDNLATTDLFDIAGYTGKLEAAYIHMHARRVAGLPPEGFAVKPPGEGDEDAGPGDEAAVASAIANVQAPVTAPASAPAPAAAPAVAPPADGTLHAFPGGWGEHADAHCIWIVSPPDYAHHHAFDEVADGFSGAFADLGGSAPVVRHPRDWNGRVPIVLGANLLPADAALPAGSVLVNLEQVDKSSSWLNGAYVSLLKRYPVLDYSPRNRAALAAIGVPRVELLEIGYTGSLTRIVPVEKDIDVLFYGSLNERRKQVLGALQARGLKVVHLFGVYGAERDAAIARAKVVLNVHFYDAAVFEIVRVSYLFANGVCVVGEGDPADPDLAPYRGGIAVEPYGGLVERCVALCDDAEARRTTAAAGFVAFTNRLQAEFLLAAMGAI